MPIQSYVAPTLFIPPAAFYGGPFSSCPVSPNGGLVPDNRNRDDNPNGGHVPDNRNGGNVPDNPNGSHVPDFTNDVLASIRLFSSSPVFEI